MRKSLQRQDRPPHLVDRLRRGSRTPSPAPCSDPSGPIAGPVMSVTSWPEVVLALAGQQRVLLRAADDQAGDDVDDLHPRGNVTGGPRPDERWSGIGRFRCDPEPSRGSWRRGLRLHLCVIVEVDKNVCAIFAPSVGDRARTEGCRAACPRAPGLEAGGPVVEGFVAVTADIQFLVAVQAARR